MSAFSKLLFAGFRWRFQIAGGLRVSRASARFARSLGYSMTEMLVVISVIGIVAMVGLGMITGGVQASKETTAKANLETLNYAVRKYGHAVQEMTNAADSGSSDEVAIITELKVDGTAESRPGSPYLDSNVTPVASSDANKYRASWNGYEFQIIGPGTNGTGVDLLDLQ